MLLGSIEGRFRFWQLIDFIVYVYCIVRKIQEERKGIIL